MVFITFCQKAMKTIVNTMLFSIFDANSLKVPKNPMFYDFSIVAGACGSQWRALAIVCKTLGFLGFLGQLHTFHLFDWVLLVFTMVFITFCQKVMKTIVNTILFLISEANALKVPKNQMFYNFRVVAGACGSQWRGAPQKGPGPPGRKVWIYSQISLIYIEYIKKTIQKAM